MSEALKEKLERNIWITRKCRINASERLLKTAKYIEFLNVWYSISIIIISLFSVLRQDNRLSILGLICSIALTVSLFYANATGYRDRSAALKQNYIELQILLDKLTCVHEEAEVLLISEKYADLLKVSENHLKVDMDRFIMETTDSSFSMGICQKIYWYFSRILVWLLKLIVLLFPLAIFIISECYLPN